MERVDLTNIPRLREITTLLRDVSTIESPQELQRAFAQSMASLFPTHAYVGLSRRGLEPGHYKVTRLIKSDEDRQNHHYNPWDTWNEIPTNSGGFLGEIIADDEPKLFRNIRIENDPVLGSDFVSMRGMMAIPLFDNGEAINWGVVFHREPDGLTVEGLDDFAFRGNLIGRMTRSLVMQREVNRLNEQLSKQLREIANIQRSLLPQKTPTIPGLKLATSYLTSDESGGDYFDFFDMGDERWGVLIADVSGHGAGAATVVAMLQSMLHGFQDRRKGPAAMLSYANRELARKRIDRNFVTAFFAVFDPERDGLTFVNAGHNPPALRKGDGTIETIQGRPSLPLGIIEDEDYEEQRHMIADCDSIVMYTDGITEAFSPPPERQMFGLEGITSALVPCTGEPACVIDSIHEKLYAHTRSRSRADDQTLVAMRVATNGSC
ncbi:MAG: PP2C family protein-serine/threonine phosphatase [Phycisphaerales bacterium]